jgi:GT2 family glycosyltransferase
MNSSGEISISLIIPCWHDVEIALELGREWSRNALVREVIIAGVSRHAPSSLEEGKLKFCSADRPGRGLQFNLGAREASGDVLLFHHVDSQLSEAHLVSLRQAMRDPKYVGGAFYRKFDERHPHLQWAEPIERWHSRTFGTLYGDQSIFVRRRDFIRLGGFAPVPLMEDVELSRRLRRAGPVVLLDPPMSTSPARQIAHGAWRTTGRNLLFLFLFQLGVSPYLLHSWYYRHISQRSLETDLLPYEPETLPTLK